MADDGGPSAGGTDRVVDLGQELYIATEQKSHRNLSEAAKPRRPNTPASSGAGRRISTQFGRADLAGLYAKPSTWLPDGSVDYNYASARVMCSNDGMALVRVTGEIDHCTAPKLSAAVTEALNEGACSIFIDLAEVTFFSAAGAIVLLGARRHCQRRGTEFALLRPSRPAQRVLAFTDLLRPIIDLRDQNRPGTARRAW